MVKPFLAWLRATSYSPLHRRQRIAFPRSIRLIRRWPVITWWTKVGALMARNFARAGCELRSGADGSQRRCIMADIGLSRGMSALCQKQTFCAAARLVLFDHLSAVASNDKGMVRPSALAVLRLITSSNLTGAWTGSSLGFSPFMMRSA